MKLLLSSKSVKVGLLTASNKIKLKLSVKLKKGKKWKVVETGKITCTDPLVIT